MNGKRNKFTEDSLGFDLNGKPAIHRKPDGFYKTHKRLINRIILILFAILLAYGVVFYRYIKDGNKKQNEQSYYNNKRYRSYQTELVPKTATTTATAKKRVYRKTKKTEPYDRYNVKEYNNPEDFYDDNYDDFFDYYDAEDYYYDHS